MSNPHSDCCTSITCYESPSAKLATTAGPLSVLAVPMALDVVPALPPPPAIAARPVDTSPPRATRDRLAQLSVLLI
jgi:hypothetical protein